MTLILREAYDYFALMFGSAVRFFSMGRQGYFYADKRLGVIGTILIFGAAVFLIIRAL